jgi:hypothetical protein
MQSTIPYQDHHHLPIHIFPLNLPAELFLQLSAAMLAPMDLSPANFDQRFGYDPETPVTEATGATTFSIGNTFAHYSSRYLNFNPSTNSRAQSEHTERSLRQLQASYL